MQRQAFLTFLCLILSLTAKASLINPTGDINGLDLRWGKTEANHLQLYNEAQNMQVAENQIHVDYLLGTNLFEGDTLRGKSNLNNIFLEAGNYNSHLLHFDTIGKSKGNESNISITFEENIIGIILGKNYLNLSDNTFGGQGTSYEKNRSRGLEHHDFLSFESSRTILVDRLWVGKYWIDDARIITYAVPEPGSMALFGLGIICLFSARSIASKKANPAIK